MRKRRGVRGVRVNVKLSGTHRLTMDPGRVVRVAYSGNKIYITDSGSAPLGTLVAGLWP